MRVLFFNEGNIGSHVLGQGQLDAALRAGLRAAPEVDAAFAGLPPLNRWQRALAIRPLPLLDRVGFDMTALRWHLLQSLRARAEISRQLRLRPADVLHVHSQSVALAMPRTLRSLPVVLSVDATVRDWWAMPAFAEGRPRPAAAIAPSAALERRALAGAALVQAWSEWAREAVRRQAPAARVLAHHPGLDLDRYRPAPRRERGLPRVLFVGGRFAAKGGPELLGALGDDLGRSVELDIVTPGPVPQRPGVRVHRLGPGDPALLDLQQQADLMCLPTHGDASPWAVLEALACATPVLATRVGAIPEMLDHGRAGVLVERGDDRGLGEAIRALLADEPRRAALAAAGLAHCRERYDAARQFAALAEVMAGLAGRPGAQAATWRRSSSRTSSEPTARRPNSSAG